MTTTSLRKVGGSLMMSLPRPLLEQLDMSEGSQVSIYIEGDCLVVKPRQKPRYTLEELLSQCDTSPNRTREDREWLSDSAVGNEVL
ncbi:MAG: AbrB/MazE/SpoVT family DNA-binding domain-containing protein [Abditibacteriaceae bacterium]